MGNCLPKLIKKKKKKKAKRSSSARTCAQKQTNVSEILSFSSRSSLYNSSGSDEELRMVENMSDVEYTSVKTFILEQEESALDEVSANGMSPTVMAPVSFQVNCTDQRVRPAPQRLVSRMGNRTDKRRLDRLKLTEEDELFMDEIVEEYERQLYLEYLLRQKKAAEIRREEHLNRIREKARDLSYGPQSRVVKFGAEEKCIGRGERG